MANYYVNNRKQPNGDHLVHVEGCEWLAETLSTTHLGDFTHCWGAVFAARRFLPTANGCKYCSPDCHIA